MNKTILMVAMVALAVSFSFSQEESKIRTGARIALNNSSTTDNYQDWGQGVTIGFAISFPIVNTIGFNTGLDVSYRNPAPENSRASNEHGDAVYDFPFNVPVLIQGMPFGGTMFYMEGGFLLGVPLFNIGAEDRRASFDFAPAFGFGWNIAKDIAVGIRSSYGVTNFIEDRNNLFQVELGLSYFGF
jgi:hypothetical protein